jgi:hypothetical protein
MYALNAIMTINLTRFFVITVVYRILLAGDESDGEGSSVLDLSGMVALMKAKEEEVAASKVKLDEAAGKLKEAEDKLKVGPVT